MKLKMNLNTEESKERWNIIQNAKREAEGWDSDLREQATPKTMVLSDSDNSNREGVNKMIIGVAGNKGSIKGEGMKYIDCSADQIKKFQETGGVSLEVVHGAEETRIVTDSAVVEIITASFYRNLVWEVVYRGDKKSVYIIDNDFMTLVENRDVHFGHGDKLDVELRIEQSMNKEGFFLNTSTPPIITKVNDIIIAE